MTMPNAEPADDATCPDCSWCGTDSRTNSFCSSACERAALKANLDADEERYARDCDQYYAASARHERDLARLARHGL